ncbi:MAG: hypothetical protein NTV01_00665 [Bacteroidia bacterium]|nr:hypothetical protein [Bacteroidia bacterium]
MGVALAGLYKVSSECVLINPNVMGAGMPDGIYPVPGKHFPDMFFKSTVNTKLEEVKRYIPVSLATTFSNISPFIQSAEINYILPLLGQPLYDLVMAFYMTPSPLPTGITSGTAAKYAILLEHIQRSLINLTYWASFDFMNVLMTDSGFHRQESDTEKSLFKYQEDSLKAGLTGLAVTRTAGSIPSYNFTNWKTGSLPSQQIVGSNQYSDGKYPDSGIA